MAVDIVIPSPGESITEGVISAWIKKDGDWVERDETVLELETDKITVEVPAPAAGALHIAAGEGDTVEVGAVVGAVDESAAKPGDATTGASAEKETTAQRDGASAASAIATATTTASSGGGEGGGGEGGGEAPAQVNGDAHAGDVRATPLAKKLADERGVDLTHVPGTGPGGRIREQDVLAQVSRADAAAAELVQTASEQAAGSEPVAPAPSGAMSRNVTRKAMSPLRQRVAQRLVEAQQTAAMLTTFNECDMTGVMALRNRHKEAFEKTHNIKLGFMSFFAKACVSALRAVPAVNSQIGKGEKGPEVVEHDYCDIAFAVGTPKGLVVPVLRNVESLSFAAIEFGLKDLAQRARAGKLTLDDMQGGTFTISNGGVYGSMMSTPILNPPQSGILGMHNIIRRPMENPDTLGEVVIRPMMYLALSYDHRIVDGGGAVTFLKHVKERIEDPARLLLDV